MSVPPPGRAGVTTAPRFEAALSCPPEIWHYVFTRCEPKTLGILLRVCRTFHRYLVPEPPALNYAIRATPALQPSRAGRLQVLSPSCIWMVSHRRWWSGDPRPVAKTTEPAPVMQKALASASSSVATTQTSSSATIPSATLGSTAVEPVTAARHSVPNLTPTTSSRSKARQGTEEGLEADFAKRETLLKAEFARRSALLDPPIPAEVLSQLPAYRAALRTLPFLSELDDATWELWKERIVAQRESTMRTYKSVPAADKSAAGPKVASLTSEGPLTRPVSEVPHVLSVQALACRLADEIIGRDWANGTDVSHATVPDFIKGVLAHVRDKLNDYPTKTPMLEDMKKLYKSKISQVIPNSWRNKAQLGCSACTRVLEPDALINHFFSKHTYATRTTGSLAWTPWPEAPIWQCKESKVRVPQQLEGITIQITNAGVYVNRKLVDIDNVPFEATRQSQTPVEGTPKDQRFLDYARQAWPEASKRSHETMDTQRIDSFSHGLEKTRKKPKTHHEYGTWALEDGSNDTHRRQYGPGGTDPEGRHPARAAMLRCPEPPAMFKDEPIW